jgi:putative sugar O-methyltransferase
MIENNLKNRFQTFKKNFKEKIYGKQWEQDKKNFDIDFIDGEFINLGKWNFLPSLYKNQFNDDELLNIDDASNLKIISLGSKKLCLPKEIGNKTLIYAKNYFELLELFIKKEGIVCEIGSGSGLFSALINEKKNTINILVDIPNVLLTAIALYFTLFPNKKFLLPNEIYNEEKLNFKNYDFIFLTPEQINLIPNESLDLGINTQSFMEMDESEVDHYLKFFNSKTKYDGYFFCSNRLRKRHYFFNYKFNFLKDFKLVFLEKDKIFYKNKSLAAMLNLLLIKKKERNQKDIKFNIVDKVKGIFYFKSNEFFYWLKKDIKKCIVYILKKIKLKK